ncbi:MAG: hypothetical protein MUF87_11050 [Anaerolineae bacterium]|nr:hypothetical protein [Anaerolineae bacterium]
MKRLWVIVIGMLCLTTININGATLYSNVPLTTATYLGGQNADSFNGVEIAPDGTIFVAGRMPGFIPTQLIPIELNGGGQGTLIRLTPDGRSILSLTRIGGWISDLEINANGIIVICGNFGMITLNADATAITQNLTSTPQDRCAIGASGATVGLNDATEQATVYNASGTVLSTWNGESRNYADVAIHTETDRVFVTGYLQATSSLQTPVLQAFDLHGVRQWSGYAFSASQVNAQNLGADSRGVRVAIGKDGQLYLAGRTDGGNTVFTRHPGSITSLLPNTVLIKFDPYNDPYNLGSGSFAWYGRFDPVSGTLERAQFLLTRKEDTKGNSLAIHAITADANGVVYLGGEAYYQIENRNSRTLAGLAVGSYEGGEPFMAAISPDFTQRLLWTPFSAAGTSAGGSPLTGVAVRGQSAVGVATLNLSNPNRRLITLNPVQPWIGGGGSEGYLAVWQNDFTPPTTPHALNAGPRGQRCPV